MTAPAPTTPSTGPGSTSFLIAASGFLSGIAAAVQAIVTPGTTVHTAVYGGGGLLLATVSAAMKLLHDRGIHVATIQAAGSDVAQALPGLRTDLDEFLTFLGTDLPGIKTAQADAASEITDLRSKVAAIPDAEAVVTAVRNALAPPPPPTSVTVPPVSTP